MEKPWARVVSEESNRDVILTFGVVANAHNITDDRIIKVIG
jgi:hypothetical protein